MVFILIFGIGGKMYMDKKAEQQAQQEKFKKNLAESKKEIIELLEWNYNDINSVIFDYTGWDGSGVKEVLFDKSLTTTPAGGVHINGWINNDKNFIFEANLDTETFKIDGKNGGYPMISSLKDKTWKTDQGNKMYKNFELIVNAVDISPQNIDYLTIKDIDILKNKGFNKNITSQQIRSYFEEKKK